MYLDHDDRYQLMKEEDAYAAEVAEAQASLAEAVASSGEWQADALIAEHRLDTATGDALRMVLYLRAFGSRAQFRWIERQLFGVRTMGIACNPYESTLIRWWLAIYDSEQRSRRHG